MKPPDLSATSPVPDKAVPEPRCRRLARRFWWISALLATVSIYTVHLTPGEQLPELAILDFDKVLHACAYAVLTLLWCLALSWQWTAWPPGRVALIAVVLCTVHGSLGELHQAYVPGRYGSVADAVANLAGALTVGGLWFGIRRRGP